MSNISPQAIVHKNVVLGKNISIGPFAIIDENTKIGNNTTIGPNVHITGWTDIGDDNVIHHGVSIGDAPQDTSYDGSKSYVIIGNGNIFREFISIHRGTKPDSKTIIQNNNMFMVYTHIAHNCVVKDNVIIVNSSSLGGYVEVDSNVFISGAVQVHQFCRIGRLAMVIPLTKISKDVPPFMLVSGSEIARIKGMNIVGLRRGDFSVEDRDLIKKAYRLLYHSSFNMTDAIAEILKDDELKSNSYIEELIQFIQSAKRGTCGHYRQ